MDYSKNTTDEKEWLLRQGIDEKSWNEMDYMEQGDYLEDFNEEVVNKTL